MITTDQNYNFNDPLKLTVLFRTPKFNTEDEKINDELYQELGIKIDTKTETEYEEFTGDVHVLWEQIMAVKSYPYKDDWKSFTGPKFYVSCYDNSNDYLVLGNINEIVAYWTMFRNISYGLAKD